MTIAEIALSFFRGASDRIALTPGNKSIAVYGPNGAGKTSFVDGVEYLATGGKIAHLAHEYSGRRLENAVINTHAAGDAARTVEVSLNSGARVTATIAANGAPTFEGQNALADWDCGRFILRQDEVAAFIQAQKGEKYSALLPLIGLGPMENVATNIRALARKVSDEASLERKKGRLQQLQDQWTEAFPGMNNTAVGAAIKAIHAKYLLDVETPPDNLHQAVDELLPILEARIAGLNAEHTVFMNLKTAHDAVLKERFDGLTVASAKAAGFAEPLLNERLGILKSAEGFGASLEGEDDILCPACGKNVSPNEFRDHVKAETQRLEEALKAYGDRKQALARLATAMAAVTGALNRNEMTAWRDHADQNDIREHLDAILSVDSDDLRLSASQHQIEVLGQAIPPVVERLAQCVQHAQPSVHELVNDQKMVLAASSHPVMKELRNVIGSIGELLAFLAQAEEQTRIEIKDSTEQVIANISGDMQRMWEILHPREPIDEVRLYQAEGVDKAIDIALRFHGKDQQSPRLTLSEGHRNSLGLCVFLALAKRSDQDLPLILDDVVTSFDLEHRANVADLLMQEFADTQVLLFTHDLAWYIELKNRLPGTDWSFKALASWAGPETGIRWDRTPQGFDEARAHLDSNPGTAAACARGILDTHMAVIAQCLEIPVPHIRGPQNDNRNALDLIRRFAGRANSKLKVRNDDGDYVKWDAPIEKAEAVRDILVPWANPGAHGRQVTRIEAERLIDSSDDFLASLKCSTCDTTVWHMEVNPRQHLRCDCGAVKWSL